mgnify:FL=1
MGTSNTFHKLEKLSHKGSVDAIFQKKGQSIFNPPILLAFLKTELHTPYPCQVFVSVGKRKFKKAIDRNRIKRQITEVYRLNKNRIYEVILDDSKYAIGILFLGKVLPTSTEIEKNVTLAINEFIKRIK